MSEDRRQLVSSGGRRTAQTDRRQLAARETVYKPLWITVSEDIRALLEKAWRTGLREGLKLKRRLELPTIEEMSGLVDDMTEGKSLKDYLEDIRND